MIADAIQHILRHAEKFEWSIQGLGMLRLYLSQETRLHVWSADAKTTRVSTLHDHPWDFTSMVISGAMVNKIYAQNSMLPKDYFKQQIVCGPGGGVSSPPEPVGLHVASEHLYLPGDRYTQYSHEIHESLPEDGTVTVIQRVFHPDTEHAHVFYRGTWVSAEPRPATQEEILAITLRALERWKP